MALVLRLRSPRRARLLLVTLPTMLLTVGCLSVTHFPRSNFKSDELRAEWYRLHPTLRVALWIARLGAADLLLTDVSRRPSDYDEMGLTTPSWSEHFFSPRDGYAHAIDLRVRDTGALRGIPGSHRTGEAYADALEECNIRERSGKIWGIENREVPATILETNPGDIVVFNHGLKHASFGGSKRRRMFTMNFSRRYPEDRLEELRSAIADKARFWLDRAYGEAMIRTAGPERMVHLEQGMANDAHLADLSRELTKTMDEPARG